MKWERFLGIDKLNPLAHANLLAARLSRLPVYTRNNVVKWMNKIVRVFEDIDPVEVCTTLNEERRESGFPEITNLSIIEEQILNQKDHYQRGIWEAMAKLPQAGTEVTDIITVAVESATSNGKKHCPLLIEDLVANYEVLTQKQETLEKIEKRIEKAHKDLRVQIEEQKMDDKRNEVISTDPIHNLLNSLKVLVIELHLNDWHQIAKPIQLIRKINGQRHEASLRLGERSRQMAIHLFNEYGELELSQQLMDTIKKVFSDVSEIRERITQDTKALDEKAKQQKQKEC